MRRHGRLLVLAGLCAVTAATQAQVVQVNQRSAATTKFSLSGTGMNTGMLSSFDASRSKVSPSIIGEVTLPGSPINDRLFAANKGPGVDDPVVANNIGNGVVLVPEPSTWAMILLGAGFLVATTRFRQRRA